jgi:hypothetical protein
MPSAAVDAAFKAKLAAEWTSSPVVGVNGVTDPPKDENAFLVIQYPVVNGEKPVLGGKYFEEGAARLVLNVKSGIGLAEGLTRADTLAALFRSQKFSGVETFAPSAPIVNDSNDDGNWFELSVIVPYRYQFEA